MPQGSQIVHRGPSWSAELHANSTRALSVDKWGLGRRCRGDWRGIAHSEYMFVVEASRTFRPDFLVTLPAVMAALISVEQQIAFYPFLEPKAEVEHFLDDLVAGLRS